MRTGLVYTKNKEILKSTEGIVPFVLNCMPSSTQYYIKEMFDDHKWLDSYVKLTRKRLTASYRALKKALDGVGIPIAECNGSLMLLADFSEFLKEDTYAAELDLWRELHRECKLMIAYGN